MTSWFIFNVADPNAVDAIKLLEPVMENKRNHRNWDCITHTCYCGPVENASQYLVLITHFREKHVQMFPESDVYAKLMANCIEASADGRVDKEVMIFSSPQNADGDAWSALYPGLDIPDYMRINHIYFPASATEAEISNAIQPLRLLSSFRLGWIPGTQTFQGQPAVAVALLYRERNRHDKRRQQYFNALDQIDALGKTQIIARTHHISHYVLLSRVGEEPEEDEEDEEEDDGDDEDENPPDLSKRVENMSLN